MDSSGAAVALAAVAACASFEGTALFLSFGDPVPSYSDESVPAQELLRGWRRMYPAAKGLQSKLVALSAAASAAAAYGLQGSRPGAAAAFGATAAAHVAILGYTLRAIMPLNDRLLPEGAVEKAEDDAGIRRLLQRWGDLHGTRTLLGAAALGAALYGTHACLTSK